MTKSYLPRTHPPEHTYKRLCRFDAPNVRWISDHFLGVENGESRGGAISKLMKMEVFLRHLSDPGFQVFLTYYLIVPFEFNARYLVSQLKML